MGFLVFFWGGGTKLLLFAMKRSLVGGISSLLDRQRGSETEGKEKEEREEGIGVVSEKNESES